MRLGSGLELGGVRELAACNNLSVLFCLFVYLFFSFCVKIEADTTTGPFYRTHKIGPFYNNNRSVLPNPNNRSVLQ